MSIEISPPFLDLDHLSPLSADRAARLARFLAAGQPATVADLGCGWARLLIQTVAAAPGAAGLGIDLDDEAIEHGRWLAAEHGVAERVELRCGEVAAQLTADAVICIGASQIWCAEDEVDQPVNYTRALTHLRAMVERGARVVYGEGIWTAPPTPAATAPLASRPDEFVGLAELVELAVQAGFMPHAAHEATLDEWDEFESGYGYGYTRWLVEHDIDHPDAEEVRDRARRQRSGYLGGYRGVLGMAYLELIAI
ncbi:MAG TPA: class I SAM-dependent methyltransferase [Jatrophihabitans sp.]|nr:class I SAM-dependent methyltransferase [Jatrophihabitans sp.]